ncbi:helix-turn-helix domain-containing protein [Acidovorax delafieldii]|uniref:helix-turn-helix domain-containing protein n=1 Tax=Acidovorax delafieldii TaxID=47920 RepID=UPI003ECD4FBB
MQSTLAERMALALAGPPKKSQKALAAACGVKAPSVNGWVSGSTKSLEGANLVSAAAFLGVNATWLAKGIGPMRGPATTGVTNTEKEAEKALETWAAKASPRSREVIDQLHLLAQKNALGDEEWDLISQLALRFQSKPKAKPKKK